MGRSASSLQVPLRISLGHLAPILPQNHAGRRTAVGHITQHCAPFRLSTTAAPRSAAGPIWCWTIASRAFKRDMARIYSIAKLEDSTQLLVRCPCRACVRTCGQRHHASGFLPRRYWAASGDNASNFESLSLYSVSDSLA
ncbi:hypothetical protein XU18_0094 [Perkinsela sp. CCAP 1560/4]|nr:hypothetical protein XU18_0094 [Perkinsela sp. CCAP 1560/4]|eukprot:KNH09409.1 hypothetical protein XU18_0094 [Perkinsela sp. CCAP 1560/4]